MKTTALSYILVVSSLFCHSLAADGVYLQVLTAINDSERRDTPLVQSHTHTTVEESFSLIGGLNNSEINIRRRKIHETDDEAIIFKGEFLVSYKNGTYRKFPLSCFPYELYDQVGLESSVVMIITCLADSTVYVLHKGIEDYFVEERISPPGSDQSSSAAIVTRNGQSTALYIGSSNFFFHFNLGINGAQVPFFSANLIPCSDWCVSASSEAKVALHCKASGRVFLASGSDGNTNEVTSSIADPDSIVHICDERMAIEITSTGVNIHRNDFIDLSPITVPMVELVKYTYVNDILCLVFFSSSSIHLLNTSNPLTDESLELIVTEESPIRFNSSYIFISPPFNSLAYVVEGNGFWTVKTIDLITREYYTPVAQPWNPLLLDMRVQVSSITPSTTTTSSSSETSFVESTAIMSVTSTSSSTVATTTQTTSPTQIPSKNMDTKLVAVILVVVLIVLILACIIAAVLVVIYCFHTHNQKASSREHTPVRDSIEESNSSSGSDPSLDRQETGYYGQERNSASGGEEQVTGQHSKIHLDQRR